MITCVSLTENIGTASPWNQFCRVGIHRLLLWTTPETHGGRVVKVRLTHNIIYRYNIFTLTCVVHYFD